MVSRSARRRLAESVRREAPAAAGAMAGASGVAAVVLRMWRIDLSVPLHYANDGLICALPVKTMLEHAWYQDTARLGAPFGQDLHDLPAFGGDHLQLLFLAALGRVTGEWGAAINLWFLAGFPLVALGAFTALRLLGVGRAAGAVLAVLYAILPFHFLRGEGHLYVSQYALVPLACLLVLAAIDGAPLFSLRRARTGWGRRAGLRTAATLGLCVALAGMGAYYAVYTIMLLAVPTVVWAARRDWARALAPAVAAGLIFLVLAVNEAPNALHRLSEGRNPVVAVRGPGETERYALKMTDLVLPISGHRIGLLQRVRNRYVGHTTLPLTEARTVALGIVGTAGLLVLAVVAAAVLAPGRPPPHWAARLRGPALLAGLLFLLGTVGGLFSLIALFVTPQLHAPARVCVFIAFLALLAVGVIVEIALAGRSRRIVIATLGAISLVGVADQTSDSFVPPYRATQASFHSDRAFFRGAEARLPAGALVYSLPYVPFPEWPPPARMDYYDDLRGYLHTRDLRWSAAQMRGRASDWGGALAGIPSDRVLPRVAAAGFAAATVDRFGYSDHGRAVEADLRRIAGPPKLTSPDGRFALYDLRGYATALRNRLAPPDLVSLRDAALMPVRADIGAGVTPVAHGGDGRVTAAVDYPRGQLRLTNPSRAVRRAVMRLRFSVERGAPHRVEAWFGGRPIMSVALTREPAAMELRLSLPPGDSSVDLRLDGGPAAARMSFVSIEELVRTP